MLIDPTILKNIKIFFTDIDGVWTDGGMYYDCEGKELKKFNTTDSAGVLFLKLLNLKTIILTGERSAAVIKRANKLKIEAHVGIEDKLKQASSICSREGLKLSQVAYIGDDINDMSLLKAVGLSAAPISAPKYVKNLVDWEISVSGGRGAYRQFVEQYLCETGQMEEVIELYSSGFTGYEQ